MKTILLMFLASTFSGCMPIVGAVSWSTTYSKEYNVECITPDGWALGWPGKTKYSYCYERANDICHDGYIIRHSEVMYDGRMSLVVECK